LSGIKRTAADRKFSLMIRERDNWTCQRCGKQYVPPTKALHCAHNHTRRCPVCTSGSKKQHVCTRLDEFNALALCYGCHQFVDSHAAEKERLFRAQFGDEQYEITAAIAHGKRDRFGALSEEI